MVNIVSFKAFTHKKGDNEKVTDKNGIKRHSSNNCDEFSKGNLKLEKTPQIDTVDIKNDNEKKMQGRASTVKKLGVGILSACIPGSGQLINGQSRKAAGFLGAAIISPALWVAALTKFKSPALSIAASCAIPVIHIASAVDAFRNAKSK